MNLFLRDSNAIVFARVLLFPIATSRVASIKSRVAYSKRKIKASKSQHTAVHDRRRRKSCERRSREKKYYRTCWSFKTAAHRNKVIRRTKKSTQEEMKQQQSRALCLTTYESSEPCTKQKTKTKRRTEEEERREEEVVRNINNKGVIRWNYNRFHCGKKMQKRFFICLCSPVFVRFWLGGDRRASMYNENYHNWVIFNHYSWLFCDACMAIRLVWALVCWWNWRD